MSVDWLPRRLFGWRFAWPLALAVACAFTGCAPVGPDYNAPDPGVTDAFVTADAQAAPLQETQSINADWWAQLNDPLLTQLITDAATANQRIHIAVANVRAARANRRIAGSRLLPSIGSGASYTRLRASENGQVNLGALADAGVANLETDLYQAGLDASWEIDIFGGARRQAQAADAQIQAAQAARRQVIVSVIAETALNYVERAGLQQRLRITKNNIKTQQKTFSLVRNKRRLGLATELDEQRAAAQLHATQANLPSLRAAIQAAGYRLAVLTNRQPGELDARLSDAAPMPAAGDAVPVGLPSDLLRRRPDVSLAERQLAAAVANVGVAKADLYPRFFLTGAAGFESTSFTDWFSASSAQFSIGPSIRWPIFQGGAIRARVQGAQAQVDAAQARFRQAVLTAVEEVETALVRYAQSALARRDLHKAAAASQQALELAQALYDRGLTDFLTVLDGQREQQQIDDQLAQADTRVAVNLILIYKALGGGWQPFEPKKQAAGVSPIPLPPAAPNPSTRLPIIP